MPNKHPILLGISRHPAGVHPGGGGSFERRVDDEVRASVFARDNHTCQFCGFQAEKYQTILSLSGNPNERAMDQLATSCIYCHQCFHMDEAGDMNSGILIWLPEIEQADLHHIARAIFVARISQGPIADTARQCLDLMMGRREEATRRLGTDDPAVLGDVMRDYLLPQHYAKRIEKLDGIRLFPLDRRIVKEGDLEFNQFPQILAYWRSPQGPFGEYKPQDWLHFYQEKILIGQAA